MPLHYPPAPSAALRSVATALDSAHAVGVSGASRTARATPNPPRPEVSLALHVLHRISETAGSPRTRLAGWRFLLRGGDRVTGAADVMPTADGWAFSHFCDGPYVASSARALQQAESLPVTYQPRLLSVPELYMLTLWLHDDITADAAEGAPQPTDLLVPLAPAPPGISAHQPHRVDELLPLLTRRLSTTALLKAPA